MTGFVSLYTTITWPGDCLGRPAAPTTRPSNVDLGSVNKGILHKYINRPNNIRQRQSGNLELYHACCRCCHASWILSNERPSAVRQNVLVRVDAGRRGWNEVRVSQHHLRSYLPANIVHFTQSSDLQNSHLTCFVHSVFFFHIVTSEEVPPEKLDFLWNTWVSFTTGLTAQHFVFFVEMVMWYDDAHRLVTLTLKQINFNQLNTDYVTVEWCYWLWCKIGASSWMFFQQTWFNKSIRTKLFVMSFDDFQRSKVSLRQCDPGRSRYRTADRRRRLEGHVA